MADEDQDASRPNLEPPKLFGRKRRADDASEPELELPPEPDPTPSPTPEADPEPEPVLDPPPEADTAADPVAERYSDPTWMFELPDEPEPEPAPAPAPEAALESAPEPAPEPARPVLPAEAGAPLFADEVEPEETAPAPTTARRERAPRKAKAPRSAPTLPTVTGWVAAAITGVVIGLLLVGMTAGSLQGCEAVRGTSTCGGAGVVLLIVIMAILVTLGGFLLRIFDVPDPVSTSFLALGMVAVISLLFLLDVMENWWMIIVIPVISAAMYLLGYWVTTAFVEPAKEPAEK